MDNKTLLEKYRTHFSIALVLTIVVASVIEILAYAIFAHIGKCELSYNDAYFRYKVVLPVLLNCIIYLIVAIISNLSKISHSVKNEIIIHGASAVAFVISVIHREFIVNTLAFMFPMILSAMFNDNKLITRTFVISLMATTVTFIFSWYDRCVNTTNLINYIVIYGFLIVSFIACFISGKYSKLQIQLIENQAKENFRLQSVVLLDQMTGLYNHRTFYEKLDSAIEKYENEKEEFCLAIIDIDKFKSINDTYGHNCGDIVINTLAEIIKANCKKSDMAFRYGGEEFAVIFANKTFNESFSILGNMLKNFSEKKYSFSDERITFSGGIAKYTQSFSREEFFAFVDSLMYKAKNNGRNQIQSA